MGKKDSTKSKSKSKGDTATLLLVEQASGLFLIHISGAEATAIQGEDFDRLVAEKAKFKNVAKIHAVCKFKDADEALEVAVRLREGVAPKRLSKFLAKELGNNRLAVVDQKLAASLKEAGVSVEYGKHWLEYHRAARQHLTSLVSGLDPKRCTAASVGLGHALSRSLLHDDPNRQDKPITNSITVIDTVDRSTNQFAMRLREWYCYHFPELNKLLPSQQHFAKVVLVVQQKEAFSKRVLSSKSERKAAIAEISAVINDDEVAADIVEACCTSMGAEVTETDLTSMIDLAKIVSRFNCTRASLATYLGEKLEVVAPNLRAVLGDVLSGRLIAHQGSLMGLAKAPASTIQILGAEKALFRALKTKGRTPKYGLLFASSAVSRANGKNKGRISRFLANKSALAARLDAFSEDRSNVRGLQFAQQVDERLTELASNSIQK